MKLKIFFTLCIICGMLLCCCGQAEEPAIYIFPDDCVAGKLLFNDETYRATPGAEAIDAAIIIGNSGLGLTPAVLSETMSGYNNSVVEDINPYEELIYEADSTIKKLSYRYICYGDASFDTHRVSEAIKRVFGLDLTDDINDIVKNLQAVAKTLEDDEVFPADLDVGEGLSIRFGATKKDGMTYISVVAKCGHGA